MRSANHAWECQTGSDMRSRGWQMVKFGKRKQLLAARTWAVVAPSARRRRLHGAIGVSRSSHGRLVHPVWALLAGKAGASGAPVRRLLRCVYPVDSAARASRDVVGQRPQQGRVAACHVTVLDEVALQHQVDRADGMLVDPDRKGDGRHVRLGRPFAPVDDIAPATGFPEHTPDVAAGTRISPMSSLRVRSNASVASRSSSWHQASHARPSAETNAGMRMPRVARCCDSVLGAMCRAANDHEAAIGRGEVAGPGQGSQTGAHRGHCHLVDPLDADLAFGKPLARAGVAVQDGSQGVPRARVRRFPATGWIVATGAAAKRCSTAGMLPAPSSMA